MTTPAATQTAPIVPVKPRRHWLRGAALLILVFAIVGAGYWWYTVASTQRAWAAAEVEAGDDLPRWRLLELEADRPEIPDGENSALFMMALRRKGGGVGVGGATNYDQIFEKLPPTAQLNRQQETLIRDRLKAIAKEVDEAYQLKDMPRGRFPIKYSDDGLGTLIPHHQEARGLIDWLQHDAYLRAHDGDCDKAVEASQAMLVGGKAFETEMFMIGILIRLAFQGNAVKTLERTLAQGQASDRTLQTMQAALQREFNSGAFLQALRGERAIMHHLCCNVRDGKVHLGGLFNMGPAAASGFTYSNVQAFLANNFPSTQLKYYPDFLHIQNRMVEIGKLPIHERRAKVDEYEAECKATSNTLIRLLSPAVNKVNTADCRTQAQMRSAAVAIACERYRLKDPQKSWPESLEILVKEKLLDAIPTDPFDNQPLRYRRTKDGIVIYSVGVDLKDDGGKIDHDRFHEPGFDIGFRLWNVDRRRQPAMPPIAVEENK